MNVLNFILLIFVLAVVVDIHDEHSSKQPTGMTCHASSESRPGIFTCKFD